MRCSHKEQTGDPAKNQVLVTFRTRDDVDFGATIMVRVSEERANSFTIGNFYELYLLPATQRATDKPRGI